MYNFFPSLVRFDLLSIVINFVYMIASPSDKLGTFLPHSIVYPIHSVILRFSFLFPTSPELLVGSQCIFLDLCNKIL